MLCPRCGKPVSLSAGNFCPGCGAGIAVSVLTPPPTESLAPIDPGDRTVFIPPAEPHQAAPAAPDDAEGTMFIVPDAHERTTFSAPTDAGKTIFVPATGPPRMPRVPAAFTAPPNDPATISATPSTDAASTQSGPLAIGESFGTRYHIIRVLGVGGMGAVYQAWDAELGVAVAIKVVRPEITADPVSAADMERRFKRELVLARQVTHKNVVRIHDMGEIDGIKYITMPYVEGADLATVLREHGRLPLPRTLRIIRSVVSGLAAAHAAGVVHRDLKPANIMTDANDEALIMDFGIARSTGVPIGGKMPGETTIVGNLKVAMAAPEATVLGAVVGTVEYMAPEQAKGVAVDQRADVYALGLIIYDMLAGRSRAAVAKSPIAELKARMEQAPPPIKSIVPEIPDAVDALVSRCLEPDPAKRYQTSADLAADLDRLDDNGIPIPLPRRFTPPMIAAAVVLVAGLVTGTWWLTRTPPAPKQHDPVTAVIADFQNTTGDAEFDHALEPMVRRALESAGFVSAYDRTRIRTLFGMSVPAKLDDVAAREIALKQGVGVVIAGSVDRRGSGYEISLKAAQTVTGKEIANARTRVSSKDQVMGGATKLVTTVRKALGDETSDSAQLLAMHSLSTTSMEVASHYAAAIEAQADGKYENARQNFLKTVELDANFGIGYQGLAIMSSNLGDLQDADKYSKEALRHLEGMTGRERFAVRASYYMNTGDAPQCVKEYGEMIAQYAADAVAHNNRGICLATLRKMNEAVDEMRQTVRILPNRVPFRANLAIYTAYAGDFAGAEKEVAAMDEPNDMAMLALSFARLGQGQLKEAADTYQKLGAMGGRAASWSVSGLGDLALYQGRFAEAIGIFERNAAADLAAKNADRAARKLTSAAYAQLMKGDKSAAVAAAEKALQSSDAVPIRFLAARIFVEANALARARTLASGLAAELPAEPQAYGKIIEGEIALKTGNARDAVKILGDANEVLDTWLIHFDLGRAYIQNKAYPQADSEFERCINRRGEALSLLLDEEPTYAYLPIVYYYQGLVREGLKNTNAADSFAEYLKIRGDSKDDPLLPEVRRRAGR